MAKGRKKRRLWPFLLAMAVYAAVFLTALGFGLRYFWGYLADFERSRPEVTVRAYLDSLTPEHIAAMCEDLIDQADSRVQSPEACREILLEAATGKITYAKNVSQSTQTKQVFVLRCDGQTVGSFEITQTSENAHGFSPWEVTGEDFDLSFLLSPAVRAVVPQGASVLVNGIPLPEACVTETGIPYPQLAEFAADYDMPTMLCYEAGPFLGGVEVTRLDVDGKPIAPDTPSEEFLRNCTDKELTDLERITRQFVESYVDFTSCTGGDSHANLRKLSAYMVPGSQLAQRMKNALDGLYWVSDRHASVESIETALCTRIGEGCYLCDVTYTVNTTNLTGSVQAVSHIKLIFRQTDSGLLAESMVLA